MATRAGDDDDRRRELALNWILLASVALAALEVGRRLPALIEGGAAVSDDVPTFALAATPRNEQQKASASRSDRQPYARERTVEASGPAASSPEGFWESA